MDIVRPASIFGDEVDGDPHLSTKKYVKRVRSSNAECPWTRVLVSIDTCKLQTGFVRRDKIHFALYKQSYR